MACDPNDKKNMGLSKCNELPAIPKGMIETPEDFSVTEAVASDPVAFLAALKVAALLLKASRLYYWPPFDTVEAINRDAAYEDTVLSFLPVDPGAYRWRFGISQNLCLHKAMYSHNTKSGRVFIVDKFNKIIGTQLSNGNFAGFSIQLINVEKMMFSDGSVASKTPAVLALRDNVEFDAGGMMTSLQFVNELYRIIDVKATLVGVATATLITVDVKAVCDGTPLIALVAADFIATNVDGSNHAITSVTESATVPGRYAIVGVGFVSVTITLRPPSTLSVKPYELVAGLAVVV